MERMTENEIEQFAIELLERKNGENGVWHVRIIKLGRRHGRRNGEKKV